MIAPFQGLAKALGFSREEQKSVTLTDPLAYELFGGVSTASNIEVGPASAMRVPAVACAVGIISEKVGDLPAKLFKQGTKETARNHAAYKLIHDEANPFTSAAQLRRDLTFDALLRGNGYALVNRAGDGRPLELLRLDPSTVQNDAEDDGTPFYRVTVERGRQIRVEYPDMLHIRPIGGVSPIKLGREAIGLAIAFERHIASLFANGGRPSGIVMDTKVMSPQQKLDLAKDWFSTHSGKNAGSTAVLDGGRTYQAPSTTLADAQFYENKIEQVREIARVFRIPPTMLFELTRGTWSNTEEMARQFYTMTLKPWLTEWAWAYARCLLTPEERETLYVEFVTDDLLTTDFAARATAYGQYRSMGVMTSNEVRSGMNLPPHPDGDSLSNPHITTTTPAAPAEPEAPASKEETE